MSRILNETALLSLIKNALAEDIGSGDATTLAIVPENIKATGVLLAKENCVCAGLMVAEKVFLELDKNTKFKAMVKEGDYCLKGSVLAEIRGDARALLSAERTALNYLQRMTGIATITHKYVEQTKGTKTKILDTRKTTPGLRMLEKYAVTIGGGVNHRLGLFDKVMIKDNHREMASISGPGAITRSVAACRKNYPSLEIEVEADTLQEVQEAAEAKVECILLDNMSNEEVRQAVKIIQKRSQVEVSGGITIDRVASLAAIEGVDFISVGALTHSVRASDISFEIKIHSDV